MMPQKITQMMAWICTEPDGQEGIPAIASGMGPLPLIGADVERIESMRPYAEQLAASGMPVKLVRFSQIEIVEELKAP